MGGAERQAGPANSPAAARGSLPFACGRAAPVWRRLHRGACRQVRPAPLRGSHTPSTPEHPAAWLRCEQLHPSAPAPLTAPAARMQPRLPAAKQVAELRTHVCWQAMCCHTPSGKRRELGTRCAPSDLLLEQPPSAKFTCYKNIHIRWEPPATHSARHCRRQTPAGVVLFSTPRGPPL